MITKELIRGIVEDSIQDTDKYIVEIQVLPGNRIEVVVDSDTSITIDDCIKISRSIESNFDREEEDFELSVFSAGLSEPLKLERQYLKNIGKEIELVLKSGNKLRCSLVSIKEGIVTVKIQKMEKFAGEKRKKQVEELVEYNLEEIKSTKLYFKV